MVMEEEEIADTLELDGDLVISGDVRSKLAYLKCNCRNQEELPCVNLKSSSIHSL